MMHNTDGLYQMLRTQLVEIDKQIESISANSSSPVYGVPVDIHRLQNTDGTYVMIPLIAAKSEILASMARLKAADTIDRANRQRGGR